MTTFRPVLAAAIVFLLVADAFASDNDHETSVKTNTSTSESRTTDIRRQDRMKSMHTKTKMSRQLQAVPEFSATADFAAPRLIYPRSLECADGNQADYRGFATVTKDSIPCQKWTEFTPHTHTKTAANYPNAGLGDHNYCRNPDNSATAWCFTTDPTIRRQSCRIPSCPTAAVTDKAPSSSPSASPESSPSAQPSLSSDPTNTPSDVPSVYPSSAPTSTPSDQPSSLPSCTPSSEPTEEPSAFPTISDIPSTSAYPTPGKGSSKSSGKSSSSKSSNSSGSSAKSSKSGKGKGGKGKGKGKGKGGRCGSESSKSSGKGHHNKVLRTNIFTRVDHGTTGDDQASSAAARPSVPTPQPDPDGFPTGGIVVSRTKLEASALQTMNSSTSIGVGIFMKISTAFVVICVAFFAL